MSLAAVPMAYQMMEKGVRKMAHNIRIHRLRHLTSRYRFLRTLFLHSWRDLSISLSVYLSK